MPHKPDVLIPFHPSKSKIFFGVGVSIGLIILVSGLYFYAHNTVLLYQTEFAALFAFGYISSIQIMMNGCFKLIQPLFVGFGRLCAQHHIQYKIVHYSRSIGINFAEGTAMRDRFKFGALFNLIFFLQVLTIVLAFAGLLVLLFMLSSIASQFVASDY